MIYIPGNVPSSKNSRNIYNGRLVDSKSTRTYKKNTEIIYKMKKAEFHKLLEGLEPPYRVAFYFVRKTRRKSDYSNIVQVVQDLMVKYDWVEDDNYEILIPVFLGFKVDKEKAGVYIWVMNKDDTNEELIKVGLL